jgi:hypothetical protein
LCLAGPVEPDPGHYRPPTSKLERYGDTLFVVLRSAHYGDESEEVDFGELHLFVGPNFVLTVRHSQAPDLVAGRRRLEHNPDLLRRGPEAVLYAVLDAVVDDYAPVVTGLQTDIDEIETEVFGRHPKVSRRIYELSREVVEFHRATRPLLDGGQPRFSAADGRFIRGAPAWLGTEEARGCRSPPFGAPGNSWICRHNETIRLPYSDIIHHTDDGIPYLARQTLAELLTRTPLAHEPLTPNHSTPDHHAPLRRLWRASHIPDSGPNRVDLEWRMGNAGTASEVFS